MQKIDQRRGRDEGEELRENKMSDRFLRWNVRRRRKTWMSTKTFIVKEVEKRVERI